MLQIALPHALTYPGHGFSGLVFGALRNGAMGSVSSRGRRYLLRPWSFSHRGRTMGQGSPRDRGYSVKPQSFPSPCLPSARLNQAQERHPFFGQVANCRRRAARALQNRDFRCCGSETIPGDLGYCQRCEWETCDVRHVLDRLWI